ncbi:MAG TPA: hypothetical protein VK508_12525 [Cyclobacteriaceae bacterium]|jgi:hypothetical protein|nr:hypothetical protein [Cyclobacteriaceae bacterium]
MSAALERKIIRWIHIVLSIPIIGYVYGPVAEIENAARMVRWVFLPVIILSGLWLWKGYVVKKWFRRAAVVKAG